MNSINTVTWIINSAETSQLPEHERKVGVSLLIDFGYNRINTWDATQSDNAVALWADIRREGWPKLIIWEGGMSLLNEFVQLAKKMRIPVLQPTSRWDGQTWVFHEVLGVVIKTRVWTFPGILEDTKSD